MRLIFFYSQRGKTTAWPCHQSVTGHTPLPPTTKTVGGIRGQRVNCPPHRGAGSEPITFLQRSNCANWLAYTRQQQQCLTFASAWFLFQPGRCSQRKWVFLPPTLPCSAEAALSDLLRFFLSPSRWWGESDPGLRAVWPPSRADNLAASSSEPPRSSSKAVFPHPSGAEESPLRLSKEVIQSSMALKDEHRKRTTRTRKRVCPGVLLVLLLKSNCSFEKNQINNETDGRKVHLQ